MKTNNPFSNNKREGEGASEIFLNYNDAENWFSNSNYLFEGHRGSGKTSILSAFNYKYVWQSNSIIKPNDTLKSFYQGKPKFLGVIFKCENQDKVTWEHWVKHNNEIDAELIYTTYLNYYFAEKFIEAIEEILKDSKYIDIKDSEYLLIKFALELGFPVNKLRPKINDYSLHTLKLIFSDVHNLIRHEIINGTSSGYFKENYCLHENCSLIFNICNLIQTNIKAFNDVLFFALIDDVNRLATWQIKCINTMQISYMYPLSFKLSSVYGLYHTKESRDPNRPIGNSDMSIVYLGYDKDPTKISKQKNIDDLLQAIFYSRVKKQYPNINNVPLETIFGKEPELNEILLNILRKSEKTKIRKLLIDYEKSNKKYFTDYWIDINNIRIPIENDDSKLILKKRDSEVYSKFRQTATFSIINQFTLGSSFEYSSLEVIKHLICGSIRRFLKICEYLWPDIKKQIEDSGQIISISKAAQSNAIKECANDVYLGIDDRILRENLETTCRKICNRFAKLFLLFISIDSLKITTECLSLKILKKDLDKNITDLVDSIVLYEAFIKIDNGDHFLIGLHPILSPRFCLPYRSPFYYSQSLSANVFRSIIEKTDKEFKQLQDIILNARIKKNILIEIPLQKKLFNE